MAQLPSAYIICGSPRSGSTMLCEMLIASGVAGAPASYYRLPDIPRWADRWNLPPARSADTPDFDRAYLNAMLRAGTADTGIFGLRLMWGSVTDAFNRLGRAFGESADFADLVERAFGPTLFIHLSRLDKVAQAVSLLRAERSGLWHLAADGTVFEGTEAPRPVAYDAVRLAEIVAERESDDKAWRAFFAKRQIEPLSLIYETMTQAPQAALATILAALGRDTATATAVAVPTAKMSDTTSDEWAQRFRAEMAS